MIEPQGPMETHHEIILTKIRPLWGHDIIWEAEKCGALEGSKRQRIYSNYVALMCNLVDEEPTCINNDVWDVVPRPKGKSIVSSKCIFKTKHSTDGSIEKFKARFVARGFS